MATMASDAPPTVSIPSSRRDLEAALRAAQAENRSLVRRIEQLRPALLGLAQELASARREAAALRAMLPHPPTLDPKD